MKCFIELWNATQAWKNLSVEQRSEYLGQIGTGLQGLMEQGVEIVCWGVNDESTSNRAKYDYFAVWKIPNNEIIQELEAAIEAAGWYNYFEQVNLSGEASTAEEIIGRMINS